MFVVLPTLPGHAQTPSLSKMSLLPPLSTPHRMNPLFPSASLGGGGAWLPLPRSVLKTHYQNSPFFTKTTPFSVSTLPRKMLCRPPKGKFIEDDYRVKKMSANEIQELVKGDRNVPLIIDFYATWCGPCILMAQELEMLAVEYENNAMIVKVDTDDEYEFARDMQVRGLPTLFFISPDPSKDAIRTEGLIPIQMMRDIIDNEM